MSGIVGKKVDGLGEFGNSEADKEAAESEIISAANVARWLNTSIFNADFVEAWQNYAQRKFMVSAYLKSRENSDYENLFRAAIWNVHVNSALATGVLQYLGAKIPSGKGVADLTNPWKQAETRRETKQEKAKRIAQGEAVVARAFFGVELPETGVN